MPTFKFTPKDIYEADFSTKMRGYDKEEVDELLDDGQQIIQGQFQLRAQIDHQLFLRGVEGGLQPMGGMAAVLDGVALAPATDRVTRDVKLPRQLIIAAGGFLNRRSDRRRGGGVLVQGDQHGWSRSLHSAMTRASTSRPINSGRRYFRMYSSGTRQVSRWKKPNRSALSCEFS